MDIILDTNIFRSDISLKSTDFDVLMDYLERTDSNLVMPQVILDETKNLYKKTLIERLDNLDKANNKLKSTLLRESTEISTPAIDIEVEVEKYIKFIKKRLKISDEKVLPYQNDLLPEISKRAIERIKPSGKDGQGFRDTLIWLSIKNYAKSCHEKQVIFISLNTSDFANSNNELDETLAEECILESTKVNYFRTTKDFIAKHSTKTDHINLDWIDEHLNIDDVTEFFCDTVNDNPSHIISSFERDTGNESTGHLNAIEAHPFENYDLFIYEMIDNTLIVNVTVKVELEVELEYYVADYGYFEYPSYDASTAHESIEADIYLSITVKNDKIVEWDISDWDFNSDWNKYS